MTELEKGDWEIDDAAPEAAAFDFTFKRDDTRLRLQALDELPTTPCRSIEQVCQRYVWVIGIERFVNRLTCERWKVSQFDSEFNAFLATRGNSIAKELFREGQLLRKFKRMAFVPGHPEFDGDTYNTWRPSPVVPIKGDTELWDRHLQFLFPDDDTRNLVLDWMAWTYQNLDQRPGVALVLVGEITGTGKSIIARTFEHIIGKKNSQRPKNSSLTGDFNSWAADCKLAIFEELFQTGRLDTFNKMKEIITEPRFEVNPKGIIPYLVDSYIAGLGTTNHIDALPVDENDRRWAIAETTVTKAEKDAMADDGHFTRLIDMLESADQTFDTQRQAKAYRMLGAIAYQLQRRNVKHFKPGKAAATSAKEAMIELGRKPLDRWLNQERQNDPFTRTLVNVREDIIARIPDDVMRDVTTRNVESMVTKWLKRHCDGVPIDAHRVKLFPKQPTKVVMLWALNDLGVEAKARIANGAEPRHACGSIDVAATYLIERVSGGAECDEDLKPGDWE